MKIIFPLIIFGILLSFMNTNARVMLFDTFEGFLDKENLHKNNIFKFEGLDELKKIIRRYKLKNNLPIKQLRIVLI